jgi:hypothetical protein
MDDKDDKIKQLEERILELEEELQATKYHLKKYTAPKSRKEYYQNNKETILEKMKAKPANPDKRKEYNRKSYIRKKEMQEKKNKDNI